MNSSISEGLPLAMGEAALAGLPVVCTDVGSSFCVVTDPTTGQKFSEVVGPNDPTALATAQINILALLGPWAAFAEDKEGHIPPTLSLRPSKEDVERIAKRMYDKAEQRRKLGLLGRANIYRNFSSERYLREHEQMLRLGDYRSRWGAAAMSSKDT
jgi:glycosyltransferase involved in cell wall biosynthesis